MTKVIKFVLLGLLSAGTLMALVGCEEDNFKEPIHTPSKQERKPCKKADFDCIEKDLTNPDNDPHIPKTIPSGKETQAERDARLDKEYFRQKQILEGKGGK